MLCFLTVSYTHLRAHETKANLVCRLLLENAISWVFRCEDEKVFTIIKQAEELCEKEVSGSNAVFLKARAKYIVSGFYRHLKQNDKALEYAEQAMVQLRVIRQLQHK